MYRFGSHTIWNGKMNILISHVKNKGSTFRAKAHTISRRRSALLKMSNLIVSSWPSSDIELFADELKQRT